MPNTTITTTAAVLVPAETRLNARRWLLIQNQGAVAVRLGLAGDTPTAAAGYRLGAGESLNADTLGTGFLAGPIAAIAESGTAVVYTRSNA